MHRYFRDFGLSGEICESLISQFSDVFITINRHILKWKCSRGLTREIRENKTTAKITTYNTVYDGLKFDQDDKVRNSVFRYISQQMNGPTYDWTDG